MEINNYTVICEKKPFVAHGRVCHECTNGYEGISANSLFRSYLLLKYHDRFLSNIHFENGASTIYYYYSKSYNLHNKAHITNLTLLPSMK